MKDLAEILKHKYPELDQLSDYIVQDNSDGKGPYIKEWNTDVPRPSDKELEDTRADMEAGRRIIKFIRELQELDVVISRFEEDVTQATGITLHGDKAAAKARKEEIRAELSV